MKRRVGWAAISSRAAVAWPEVAERWHQNGDCQRLIPTGFPSPEATESPTETSRCWPGFGSSSSIPRQPASRTGEAAQIRIASARLIGASPLIR